MDEAVIAEAQLRLAFALYATGDPLTATEASDLYTDLLNRPDTMLAVRAGALEGLADMALRNGQFERADSLYRDALRVRLQYQEDINPEVARTRWGLVFVQLSMGRPDVAEEISRTVIATLEASYGSTHNDVAFGYVYLGLALERQGRAADAADAYMRAIDIYEEVSVPGHRATADAWRRYGEVVHSLGRKAEARRAFLESRRVYSVGFAEGVDTTEVGDAVARVDTLLAASFLRSGQRDQAVDHLRAALDVATDSSFLAIVRARLEALGSGM